MTAKEALYGGAAGGGKSDAGLMGALQYVHIPGYSALLLRRTFPQLSKPDGLVRRAKDWLSNTDAVWNEKKMVWTFPSGALVEFGHMQHEDDKYNYEGAAYQYVFFDELTQFLKAQFQFLHSRTRRPSDSSSALSRVPIRVRAASNPGGFGHDWVKKYFVDETIPDRIFLPAKLYDNPHIDHTEYVDSLGHLDHITKAQYLDGNWTVRHTGGLFRREWFIEVPFAPQFTNVVRWWDLAHSRPRPGADPDYTVGLKMGERDGYFCVLNIRRMRGTPYEVEQEVARTAHLDGYTVPIRIEQEPAGGKTVIDKYVREVLKGFDVQGVIPGSKEPKPRYGAVSSATQQGYVSVVEDINGLEDFYAEVEAVPESAHDDQATAFAGAHLCLAGVRDPEPAIY